MEDYVLSAIEGGIKHLGFSDHVPRVFPDGYERSWKVQSGDASSYLSEAKRLSEKYKEKIKIYVGFEAEYYPECGVGFREKMIEYGAEYLILGEHFVSAEDERDEGNNRHTVLPTTSEEKLKKYASALESAMATGLFTYVAHPDIIGFRGDSEVYRREVKRICEASLRYSVPLEINLLGIREGRKYPRREFWEIAAETGSPVTVGCDAHRAVDVCDTSSERVALSMIGELSLNYIGMPTLRLLK